jgi:hypothetical protein
MAWSTAGYIRELEERNSLLREELYKMRLNITKIVNEMQRVLNLEEKNEKNDSITVDTFSKS